jgi:hypothetical protein
MATHLFLRDIGIKHNNFFLALHDPDLANIDPHDPRLNQYMKAKVFRECMGNYWYFLREVVRIPDQGGNMRGEPYRLHRGNLAYNYCAVLNLNVFYELPRQQGKTVSVAVRKLWEFLFGTTNSKTSMMNKKYDDTKENLQKIRGLRELLPPYLQFTESSLRQNGTKTKIRDRVEELDHPTNNNTIKTLPGATSETHAQSVGRGLTVPSVWMDEFAWIKHNKAIYLAAIPGYTQASINAKRNGAPHGITLTTTPGDLLTPHGMFAAEIMNDATVFNELWYDDPKEEIYERIRRNTRSSFVYIKFNHVQLGCSEEWFAYQCTELLYVWSNIRREVLLEWITITENSPFTKEDLERVKMYLRDPIKQIRIGRFYTMDIYKEMNIDTYVPIIGVDPAGGLKRDASAITVIDSQDTSVAATFNCNYISPIDLAAVVYELVDRYMPHAIVAVESTGGFGSSIIAKLKGTQLKRNLYFEWKEKVTEERTDGIHMARMTKTVKSYGIDNTSRTRDAMMEILRQRMEYHKDKFVSRLIFSELETLEVKKSGRIEHSKNAHDDQVFSMLLALYVWYEGKNLMETWGLRKNTLYTDDRSEVEEIWTGSVNTVDLTDHLRTVDTVSGEVDVHEIWGDLEKSKGMTFAEWDTKMYNEERDAMTEFLKNPINRMAYEREQHAEITPFELMRNSNGGVLPMKIFSDMYEDLGDDESLFDSVI